MKPACGAWMLSTRTPVGAGIAEAVHDPAGDRDPGARAAANRLPVDEELDLALEDEERVDVVFVGVRVDALPAGVEAEVERLELRQFGQDPPEAVLPLAELALARLEHDGVHGADDAVCGRPARQRFPPNVCSCKKRV